MAQINLLQGQSKKKKTIVPEGSKIGQGKSVLQGFKFDFNIKNLSKWFYWISSAVVAVMVVVGGLLFYSSMRIEKEFNATKNKELILSGSPKEMKDLQDKKTNLEGALKILKDILENKTFIAPIMNALSNDVVDGIWFNQVVFLKVGSSKDKDAPKVFNLKIRGSVFSASLGNEIDILEQFTRVLKEDGLLKGIISNINIGTVSKGLIAQQEITNFDMEILFK